MFLNLKEMYEINHDITNTYIKQCIKNKENPPEFFWDFDYLLYRFILSSISSNPTNLKNIKFKNNSLDEVRFFVLGKEISLEGNDGFSKIIEVLNSKNKDLIIKFCCKTLDEDYNEYLNNENREDFLFRLLIKLICSDNLNKLLEADLSSKNNLIEISINGIKIDAQNGIYRIIKWI